MIGISNISIGHRFEEEFSAWLYLNGFWAHLLTQNAAGQPADIIAVRNEKAYLIDCKVCEKDRFALSRIESNQLTAMMIWKSSGNDTGLFALKLTDNTVYMFTLSRLLKLSKSHKSLNRELIEKLGEPADRWLESCG